MVIDITPATFFLLDELLDPQPPEPEAFADLDRPHLFAGCQVADMPLADIQQCCHIRYGEQDVRSLGLPRTHQPSPPR
jgi:hypothetical protein